MSDNPFVKPITGMHLVQPKVTDQGVGVVILERIEPGVVPVYCVHGRVTCHWCDEWCWLGSETYELVAGGDKAPMCQQCGAEWIPRGMTPDRHVDDHHGKE